VPLYNTGRQMILAVLICFIDICESISIAKALAQVGCWRQSMWVVLCQK
jgi:sulfate transporter 4